MFLPRRFGSDVSLVGGSPDHILASTYEPANVPRYNRSDALADSEFDFWLTPGSVDVTPANGFSDAVGLYRPTALAMHSKRYALFSADDTTQSPAILLSAV